MCLLVFYVNPNPGPDEFALLLINVRDEIYDRPAKPAHFWENHPEIVGGMDLEVGKEGGTWLGMNKNGKVSVLLNILQPSDEILPDKKGRGSLAVGFLTSPDDCMQYLRAVQATENEYNGFILVTLDFRSLENPTVAYFSKFTGLPPLYLEPGIHAFGNSIEPNKPWPRTMIAKEKFTQLIKTHGFVTSKDIMVDKLFCMLQETTQYGTCELMKQQGRGKSMQLLNKMSSIFIKAPEVNYGSRCHTVIMVDGSGFVDFYEKSRRQDISPSSDEPWISNHYSFTVTKSSDQVSNCEESENTSG